MSEAANGEEGEGEEMTTMYPEIEVRVMLRRYRRRLVGLYDRCLEWADNAEEEDETTDAALALRAFAEQEIAAEGLLDMFAAVASGSEVWVPPTDEDAPADDEPETIPAEALPCFCDVPDLGEDDPGRCCFTCGGRAR